ncbi:MAG: addiction module toxin RelE [Clostridiales bacterium]|nr:MAG: addiction module toxin RelE [Clostridiales bacterium]
MDKYKVLVSPKTYRELDSIYEYVKTEFKDHQIALEIVNLIEENILKLEIFPHRGSIRKVGIYANKQYRQIFIKNYTIIYRIDEENKDVIIITIRYSSSNF